MPQTTDEAWEAWAVQDPYYSVLTDPKFRSAVLTAQAREEFFGSGRVHVAQVLQMCRDRLDTTFAPRRVLDFGCGVGRLVIPFAQAAQEVVGVDISPTMLAEARRNCDERAVAGVKLILADDAGMHALPLFDLVHSSIVLQHVEIPRGRRLFADLVGRLAPGGCGAIHITFAWNVHAASFGQPPAVLPPPRDETVRGAARTLFRQLLKPLRRTPDPQPATASVDPEMQMNFYNLSELFFILQQAGIQRVHTEMTDHGGALGAFLYFQMPAPSPQLTS